jgi:hypothetical protein
MFVCFFLNKAASIGYINNNNNIIIIIIANGFLLGSSVLQ